MGFEAMMKGKERVVAGNASVKLQGAMARFVPEKIEASMHKKMAATPRSK